MFNKKLNNRTNTGERLTRGLVPALVAAAGLAIAAPATAQDWEENYEWEPGTGYHEEEWYDPTDWFDDDFYNTGIDYEETGYDWWRDGDEAWSPGYDNDYYADYDGDRSYWENRDREPNARYDYTWSGWDNTSTQGGSTDSDFYTDEDDPVDYDYWDSRRDYDFTSQANQQDRQRMIQNAELRGRLDGWQRRNLQGQKDAHTLVRVRMENGRSAIVNLGPNVELSRLDLQDGDRIAVAGKRGTIDGKDVLMAQKVRTGDKIVRMNNWEPQQQSSRDRMQREYDRQRRMQAERQRQMQYERQRQMRAEHQQRMQDQRRSGSQVRGKLENWQRVDLEGQKDAHTLVRLRMDDGRSAIVNFGPNVELSRLDLEQGDHVAVRGMPGSINDKDVLMAQYVQVIDSTTIRMDNWDPTGKDGSGSTQSGSSSTQSKAKQKSGQSEQSE